MPCAQGTCQSMARAIDTAPTTWHTRLRRSNQTAYKKDRLGLRIVIGARPHRQVAKCTKMRFLRDLRVLVARVAGDARVRSRL